ncbi:hypothetical protein TISLANDTSLP1_12200 [Thermodesulfovibrio yellowstonii]|uniref:Uncharacterized protein n=2 Tax=Thermodesulfovibrionaceae TaxID=2811504 RepID=A0A9W6GGI8_9BACT|nr:hypothetical protein TISLANDTSLP1_12200 [Thermodesulfovibrio islandicus]
MHLMNEKIDILKDRVKELEKKGILSRIEELLKQLKEFIIQEDKERLLSGMTEICAKCGKEGKACCGSAIEFKYTDELLLINILLGTKFPDEPEFPDMCFFLTTSGCVLFARDAFCINFICDKIKEKIPLEKLKRLRELEGLHLQLQFRLEQILKQISGDRDSLIFYDHSKLNYFHI